MNKLLVEFHLESRWLFKKIMLAYGSCGNVAEKGLMRANICQKKELLLG